MHANVTSYGTQNKDIHIDLGNILAYGSSAGFAKSTLRKRRFSTFYWWEQDEASRRSEEGTGPVGGSGKFGAKSDGIKY